LLYSSPLPLPDVPLTLDLWSDTGFLNSLFGISNHDGFKDKLHLYTILHHIFWLVCRFVPAWDDEVEAIEDVGFEASVLNEVERNVRATRCVGNVKPDVHL